MIAFVFSGGGSRGAMEAGAVKALYEAGIRPDMVVGSPAAPHGRPGLGCMGNDEAQESAQLAIHLI